MLRLRTVVTLLILALVSMAVTVGAQTPVETKPLDVPYVPTKEAIVDRMLRMAKVKQGDVLYDLGCGAARAHLEIHAAADEIVRARGQT